MQLMPLRSLGAVETNGAVTFGLLPSTVSLGERFLALEHFPTGMNRWGFPKWRESGSSCVLAKEVSMYGQGAFG